MKFSVKSLIVILLSSFALFSCMKASSNYDDYYDGTSSYHPTEEYMLEIVDNLVVDHLKLLEDALAYNAGKTDFSYKFPSKDAIMTDGTLWEPTLLSTNISGVAIRKIAGKESWELKREGEYTLRRTSYPTFYSIIATRHDPDIEEGTREKPVFSDWEVTLELSRNERDGYSCKVKTDSPLYYSDVDNRGRYWTNCKGLLSLDVYKDNTTKDHHVLVLNGYKSESIFE